MHYTLAEMLLDIVQNSIEAKAQSIDLSITQSGEKLTVSLSDDGCGMTEGELEKAKDPFYSDGQKHKHRRVGLGIPFLIQMVEQAEGSVHIQSEKNQGTSLNIDFNTDHWDMPPMGDWTSLLLQAFCFEGDYEMLFQRSKLSQLGEVVSYTISRKELKEVLGGFNDIAGMDLLKDYIQSQEDDFKETL